MNKKIEKAAKNIFNAIQLCDRHDHDSFGAALMPHLQHRLTQIFGKSAQLYEDDGYFIAKNKEHNQTIQILPNDKDEMVLSFRDIGAPHHETFSNNSLESIKNFVSTLVKRLTP